MVTTAAAFEVCPVGSITAFAATPDKVPTNWLICDGRMVKKFAPYDKLFAVIGTTWGGDGADGFCLPDLRGTFLRGVDKSAAGQPANTDPDSASRTSSSPTAANPGAQKNNVGSMQEDALQTHEHRVDVTFRATGSNGTRDADDGNKKFNCDPPTAAFSLSVREPTGARVSTETRPRNAYVYFIIKYA